MKCAQKGTELQNLCSTFQQPSPIHTAFGFFCQYGGKGFVVETAGRPHFWALSQFLTLLHETRQKWGIVG